MGSGTTAMALTSASTPSPGSTPATIPDLASMVAGIDVSSHQPSIDWSKVAPHINFVYAKATEGTYYVNPLFDSEYEGPYDHGVIRGSYHFAVPSNSSGTAQADYFIAHGGGWSADGKTLPGALDIEYNPYGKACYGLSTGQMVNWIKNFTSEYAAKEHAFPVIYSTTDWWRTCTGDSAAFADEDPFWVANYGKTGGSLPSGWGYYSFWQYSDSGTQPGDQDLFNGPYAGLRTLAANG
jgi:GH25 family lysozyme M1 (1,4-beta-N-acetylmuramidase)